MGKYCCVKGCRTDAYPKSSISLHAFPVDEEMRKKWISVIPLKGALSKNSTVCSLHFKSEDYKTNLPGILRRLKPNAVPSLLKDSEFLSFNRYGIRSRATANMITSVINSAMDHSSGSESEISSIPSPVMLDTARVVKALECPDEFESSSSSEECKMEINDGDVLDQCDPLAVTKSQTVVNLVLSPPTAAPQMMPCKMCQSHSGNAKDLPVMDLAPKVNNLQILLNSFQKKNRKLTRSNRNLRERLKSLQEVLRKIAEKSKKRS